MTNTKRIYNRKNKIGVFHPYKQVCMGNCPRCKDEVFTGKEMRALKKSIKDVQAGRVIMYKEGKEYDWINKEWVERDNQ